MLVSFMSSKGPRALQNRLPGALRVWSDLLLTCTWMGLSLRTTTCLELVHRSNGSLQSCIQKLTNVGHPLFGRRC